MDTLDPLFDALVGIGLNAGNYEERKVANDTIGDITIDTADTYDCGFETAIRRGDGDWVIVTRYRTKESAIRGHANWIDRVKDWIDNNEIPESVYSVQTEQFENL